MMDALATIPDECHGLEEIERQNTIRVNSDDSRHKKNKGWALSPNIARASASREPKPQKPAAVSKPAPVIVRAVAPPSIEITGRVLAVFSNYDGLQNAVRGRVDEMEFTRLEVDHLSGNQHGYSGKLLGPKQRKKFGKQSLGNTLGAVGSYLAMVEDPEQVAKLKVVSEALSALCAVAALGITRKEFERIADLTVAPKRSGISSLGDALGAVGCKLALVEESDATKAMLARAQKRRRPLRQLKLLPPPGAPTPCP